MRLIPLEIGRIETQTRAVTGRDGAMVFPVASWLIDHPKGLILFDTGMHVDLQTSNDRIGEATANIFNPNFPAGEELSARLDQRTIRPTDIDMVVLSHLHFDHAGGTEEIPDARIVVQHDEWEAGHDERMIDVGIYNPADYDHGHEIEAVTGEHDVFGDGCVVCLPTPGHTRGHQSLRVELASGPVVLTGDCIYTGEMLDEMIVPPFGSERAQSQQRDSMRYLQSLRDEHGCALMFGHDETQFRALPSDGLV